MAELATIARPYAEALFKASNSEQTLGWLGELAQIAADGDLQAFAASPGSTASQILDLFGKVGKAPLPQEGQNFLRTVVDNGRLPVLPEIAAQYKALRNKATGTADAEVYSPYPLDAAAKADLKTLLEKKFGKSLNLIERADAGLIAGVRVVVGDEVLDTSVRARLEKMKTALLA